VKAIHAVFLILLALVAALAFVILMPEPPMSAGGPHPEFAVMSVGGDGLARLASIGWLPFFIHVGTMGLVLTLIYMSLGRHRKQPRARLGLIAIAGVILYTWYTLFSSYMAFLESGQISYTLGFPTPTAIMIFGIWAASALLAVFYYLGFRTFIFTHEDEAKYEAILKKYKRTGPQKPGDDA
jgi:hypothetical protein